MKRFTAPNHDVCSIRGRHLAAFAIAASFLAFALPEQASAGSLVFTPGSLILDPVGVANTSAFDDVAFGLSNFTFEGGNAIKLSGNQIFTDTDGGGGTVTLSFSGSGDVVTGDLFSIGYNFGLTLTGPGSVVPSVTVNGVVAGFIPVSVTGTLPTATAGTTPYSGTRVSSASPLTAPLTYNASVTFTWTGATAGDTLRINVPQISIDFAASPTPVPEPAAGILLACAASLAGLRRRR